jgi:hypothetical protein
MVSANRTSKLRLYVARPSLLRFSSGGCPCRTTTSAAFRLLDELSPAQIVDAQSKIRELREKTEAISEIEARTNEGHKCPFCGDDRRQQ